MAAEGSRKRPRDDTESDDMPDELLAVNQSEEEPEPLGSESDLEPDEYRRHSKQFTISTNCGRRRKAHDLRGCGSITEYTKLNKISEGAYGTVWRAAFQPPQGPRRVYALKEVKMEKEKEGFPLTALREINLLMTLRHPNIVHVRNIVTGSTVEEVFLVMEYVEHDLKYLMENMKHRWSLPAVKCLLIQLLSACRYMHEHWVIHRDLKTSNILYNNKGELKVCDFGLARLYGEPVKRMTAGVVTLWYRAPEILLGAETYTPALDLWSAGCIFAELLQQEALCRAKTDQDQLQAIFKEVGTPSPTLWEQWEELPVVKSLTKPQERKSRLRLRFPPINSPDSPDKRCELSENGHDLLVGLLCLDHKTRITAEQGLRHPFLISEEPAPLTQDVMPSFRATNEVERKKRQKKKDD